MAESGPSFANIVRQGHSRTPGNLRIAAGTATWKDKRGNTVVTNKEDVSGAEWTPLAGECELRLILRSEALEVFRGFSPKDKEVVKEALRTGLDLTMVSKQRTVRGQSWGDIRFEGNSLMCMESDVGVAFDIPLTEISQVVLQPKSKNELAIEMHTSGAGGEDELTEIRLWVPAKQAGGDSEEPPSKKLQTEIIQRAGIDASATTKIVTFPAINFLQPRGRNDLDILSSAMKLHGKTYDYVIRYSSIVQLYKLPRVDVAQDLLMISLEPPLRQGNTSYPYVVLSFPRDEVHEAELNIDEESLQQKYEGKLSKQVKGKYVDVVAVVLRTLSDKKLISKTPYSSAKSECALRCSLKQNEGQLFPLDKRFVFVLKPVVIINYKDIVNVEFARMQSKGVSTQNFDISIKTRQDSVTYQFSNIDKGEYQNLVKFLKDKSIVVKNMAEEEGTEPQQVSDGMDSDDSDSSFEPGKAPSSGDENPDDQGFKEEEE